MNSVAAASRAKVRYEELQFESDTLSEYRWPVIKIDSSTPGARLCVMAGMHINEVSSMEAALSLVPIFERQLLAGSVEIMPVVNMPAIWTHTVQTCPADGKNINFSFPGAPSGSFSPALANALLNEWAGAADLLIDMHGGDLPTEVARFTMIQLIGEDAFDRDARKFADCFDADLHVEFEPGNDVNAGRACNARPALGMQAVMSEAGGHGLIDATSVDFHVNGVLGCAARLSMILPAVREKEGPGLRVGGFERLRAPVDGRFYASVDVMEHVSIGQSVGQLKDVYGRVISTLTSPCNGVVVYKITHPMAAKGALLMGIGTLM